MIIPLFFHCPAILTIFTCEMSCRWLRDRMGSMSTEMQVVMRIMDFVLSDNIIDISKLRYALQRQVKSLGLLLTIVKSATGFSLNVRGILRETNIFWDYFLSRELHHQT